MLTIYIMFLSFNNKFNIKLFFISGLILIVQINFPSIIILEDQKISLDLILIFLTILVFTKSTYKIIFLAFIFGIIQDLVVGVNQIGLISFIKSLTVFILLFLRSYDTIWNINLKLFFVFLVYLFHYLFFYLVIYNQMHGIILILSLIQTIISISILYLFNRFLIFIK